MSVPLSDERLAQIRRWIDEQRPVNCSIELLAELDRLRADNEALQADRERLRAIINNHREQASRGPFTNRRAVGRQANLLMAANAALRAQVEAVRALVVAAEVVLLDNNMSRPYTGTAEDPNLGELAHCVDATIAALDKEAD